MSNLTAEELRLAKDAVDRLSPQGCAELLEWAKREFPGLFGAEGRTA